MGAKQIIYIVSLIGVLLLVVSLVAGIIFIKRRKILKTEKENPQSVQMKEKCSKNGVYDTDENYYSKI